LPEKVRERRFKTFSIRTPVILFTIILVLIVTLTVLWNVVLVEDLQRLREAAAESGTHWVYVGVGSALFLAIIVLLSILSMQLISSLRWSQRQSNFIASVSHELNSPLSAIKLSAQTLRRADLDPSDRTNFVSRILSDVERLARIIANILRAAEVDNRGEELAVTPVEVDLHAYLHHYMEEVGPLIAGKLDLSLAGDAEALVEVDPLMFRQVLDNLLDNSSRYRKGDMARVELRLSADEDWTTLEVVDDGVGIPVEGQARVFDRFYRIADTAARAGRKGMGIGLYVVRTIIQGHGGRVGARSRGPGQGTTIWIRLPSLKKAAVPG
jgi:signal transduction histidine kinase